ncbi:MAG: sn-glycerol-1-phosphate dehydrogenase [Bacteroidales bacterium]|nr:sn-glycerol-1-phosphate dehydrogenase [Bacteroidales bacterium]
MSKSFQERIAYALSISTDTRVFEMGRGFASKAPEVFKQCFPGRKAMVVADVHTWPVLGEKVYKLLMQAGVSAEKYIIEKEEFHAEWKYVEMVDKLVEGDLSAAKSIERDEHHIEADAEKAFRPTSDDYFILVSVGSGVINDLCKLCSHHHGQSYLTLPTAASVDGYSSFGASISYQHSKQTFSCPAPVAILADTDVIAAAPKEMTAAGYADLAAKVPAGAEWMIADFVGSEPIQPADAWHVLQDYLDDFLSRPEAVAAGDPDAIADIFEGLTLSGIAMQAARSSRPASCCDHLFSHILDMTEHRFKGKLQSHGFQVAVGTMTMCAVFDELFKLDLTKIDVDACVKAWPSLEQEQQRALEIFKDFPAPKLGYTQITEKYNDQQEVRRQLEKLKAEWPVLKEKLQAQVWPFARMQDAFKKAGAPYDPSMIGVSREQLKGMFPIVQLMRYRYNLLDLAKRGGFYDEIVEPVFAKGGAWEI